MNVSIVIPIFNGLRYLPAFFESLEAALPDGAQVILVDDGSNEPVFDAIPDFTNGSEVVKLRNDVNVGYSTTVNRGFREATGDVIVQLNTDLILRPDTIVEMLGLLDRTPDAGLIGSKLIYPTTGLLQLIGITFGNHTDTHLYYGLRADHPLCMKDREVQATTAAIAAMRRQILNQLGPFDERFFNCHEDLDYCLRASQAGLRNIVCATSVAYHWESLSGPNRFAMTASSTATFWSKWGKTYRPDLGDYIGEALDHLLEHNPSANASRLQLLNLTRSTDDSIAIAELEARWPGVSATERSLRQTSNQSSALHLPLVLPHWMLSEPTPFVYLVGGYRELANNAYWFEKRRAIVTDELIVDLTGVAMFTSELSQYEK